MSKAKTALITPWRLVILGLFGMGAYILYLRFSIGLGEVTNLSDSFPWGLWVGFDILAGIGLAAGGFVMAATVYVFQMKRYKPIVRMAILTALLGYMIFVVGLLIEIGRPWNMWRVMTNWNIHSPLFEVAWCVMLYLTVLVMEFSVVVFERLKWQRLVNLHHKVAPVLVIMGAIISTLHQSTLGTLFTIMPYRMHDLWYTPLQPITFFISCIAGGLAMVCFESFLSNRFLEFEVRMDILPRITRAMAIILVVYFIYRLGDLTFRGVISSAFVPGIPALLFWMENFLFVVIPVALVTRFRLNMPRMALFFTAFSTVLGFIMHRFNVAITAREYADPVNYFPHWMEFVVTGCLIAAGFVAAGIAVKLFPTLHDHGEEKTAAQTEGEA